MSGLSVHFRSAVFETLMRQKAIVHVLTAPHRPQSNGISERFVRTLKRHKAKAPWLGTRGPTAKERRTMFDYILAQYRSRA